MPCVKWLWHEGEIWVYIFASKHTFHRFAHMWLIHWKPLLYSCYLMYDDAISMVDFNFWAYEIFEFMVMNVCCCCLNLTMPRILPWLCLFCCWLMLHDDDVAWPCLFLDAEYVLFMFDDWLMNIGDDEYMMLLSLNPSFFPQNNEYRLAVVVACTVPLRDSQSGYFVWPFKTQAFWLMKRYITKLPFSWPCFDHLPCYLLMFATNWSSTSTIHISLKLNPKVMRFFP